MNKLKLLDDLRSEWDSCTRCDLCKKRNNVVFGSGNVDAHILLVGEGPGQEEDETGKPFVGLSGDIINKFIRKCGLDRNEDFFVTNVVCCRPTMKVKQEHTGRTIVENRPPTKEEREACLPRLLRTIYIVDPMVIITVGKVATQALTGKGAAISKIRGDIQTMHFPGLKTEIRYPVLPMYHPAFLTRSYNYGEEGPWNQTIEDFHNLKKIVDYLRTKYYGLELKEERSSETKEESEDGESGEEE